MVKINNNRRYPSIDVEKKTIRKPVSHRPVHREPEEEEVYTSSRVSVEERASRNHHGLWFVAFIAVIFFLFSLSYFFAHATVVIDPKVKDVTLDLNLSAGLDGGEENLSFDTVSISGEVSKTVAAQEKKEVSESARGVVVIYNKFSTAPQKLDINTRLEGSNGKIYKTEKLITVPGMTGLTPGSVEVVVYGSEAGEAYNSEPLDFKVFGFKGTPKYEKFYGRSKDKLSGGFKGLSNVVSTEDKTKAMTELKNELRDKLLQKATDQIPSGFILLKDAISLETEDINNLSMASSNTLSLTLRGTLHGILFEEKKLTTKIADQVIDDYDGTPVYIANTKDIVFKLVNSDVLLKDAKTIDFNMTGKAKMVWELDSLKLTSDLLGKKKGDFNQVLLQYGNVVSANLSLSPMWNRTIPENAKDIDIIINYPNDQVDVVE